MYMQAELVKRKHTWKAIGKFRGFFFFISTKVNKEYRQMWFPESNTPFLYAVHTCSFIHC